MAERGGTACGSPGSSPPRRGSSSSAAVPLREESNEVPFGFDRALRDTFFFMERRRIQRQASGGRMVKTGIFAFAWEMFMFLGLGMYGLTSIRIKVFGDSATNLRYLTLPIVLTVLVLTHALHESLTFRENLPLVWAKTWGWLLVIWSLWVYEPEKHSCKPTGDSPEFPFILGEQALAEGWLFASFVFLEAITFLVWIIIVKLYPWAMSCCYGNAALRWFWRVRRSRKGDGWLSYRPNGPFSFQRFHCQYEGGRDADGRPHGHGIWRDDSHHGEVLEGEWSCGLPKGRFVSRTFGTGALSMGLKIGYGTSRAESLTQLFLCPRRAHGQLRHGILQVECSAAGGFLSHLPQGMAHSEEFSDATAMLEDLQHSAVTTRQRLSRTTTSPDEAGNELHNGPCPSFHRALSWDAHQGSTALVFVHGYNCPLDWACMRLGQLFVLGKFPPEVLPVVFSWPSGASIAYIQARNHLPDAAPDFVDLLVGLRDAGLSHVHIIAHSMGCELVTAALPQLQSFTSTENRTAGTGDAGGHFNIPTITFFNGTNSQEAFFGPRGEMAQRGEMVQLLEVCGRLTLYNDKEDTALKSTEWLGGRGRVIGRHTKPLPEDVNCTAEERARVDIVDCTSMDANVGGVRHNYFNLQPHIVGDLQELVCQGRRASRRSRLVRTSMDRAGNVFAFLAPPVFVSV